MKLKGTNFLGTLWAFEQRYGSAGKADVLGALEGELHHLLHTRTLLTSGWYEAAHYDGLLRAIVEVTGEGEALVTGLAKHAVARDFRTLFRLVRLVISPSTALKHTVRLSARYVQGGKIELLQAERALTHYRFTEFYGYTPLLWLDWIGGIEAVLENFGCEDVVSTRTAGGEKDFLDVLFRWR